MSCRYYPQYAVPIEGIDSTDADWLAEQQGEGPLELIDVADVCSVIGVEATLHDATGRPVGWVHANGSYRLQ